MAERPTIKEVSRLAGVSFKTVSRVLNKEKHVAEETRQRVENVVARLNFRRSAAARVLAGAKSHQVALLFDNASPHYIFHLRAGAQDRCQELGFRLLLQPCDSTAGDIVQQIEGLIDETYLDGLILSPPTTEAVLLLEALERRGVPYVRISPGCRPGATFAAAMDDEAASCAVTQHLIDLGHRQFGFIGGPANHSSAAERWRGFLKALDAAGIACGPDFIRHGDYGFGSGRQAAIELLSRTDRPTAIVACNDDMAAGVLSVAHENGIAVPGELSITGFDDSELAKALWPPLTTIHQPVRNLAYAAADLLLSSDRDVRQVLLDYSLVIRGSTGSPGIVT